MTLVVKLGSSIVAADDGSLRVGVLDSVCAQASALRRAGEPLVMVTSGSIARGIRILGLETRPRAIDELQAASAVGQGALFREYETRLEKGESAAAQVLLTAADVASRTSYLYARQTLRRLLEWGVIPVINENDTTATDEITFGDNDFLAAQVAIMLEARLLVLLTNTDGVYTADPGINPGASLIERVSDFSELADKDIGDRTSVFGSGGMRSKVAARGSGSVRVTRPSSEASSPLTIRPVKVNSLATSSGRSLGRVAVMPMSGTSPQWISRMLSFASGEAIRRSAPSAICSPPPRQLPWIAAITGTGTSLHAVATR